MTETAFSPVGIMFSQKMSLASKLQEKMTQFNQVRESLQQSQDSFHYKTAVHDITEGELSVQPAFCDDVNEETLYAVEEALAKKQKGTDFWISQKAYAMAVEFWLDMKTSKCSIPTTPQQDETIIKALEQTLIKQDGVDDFIQRIENEPYSGFFKAPCKKTAVSRFLYNADPILTAFEEQELPGMMPMITTLADQKLVILEQIEKAQLDFKKEMRAFLKNAPQNNGQKPQP